MAVVEQRRGEPPAVDVGDGARTPIHGADSTATTLCRQVVDDAVEFAGMEAEAFAATERNAANPLQVSEFSDE